MVEPFDLDLQLKAEMASIIVFLGHGAAVVVAQSGGVFELKRKGSNTLRVSVAAIIALARNNRIKRDGKTVQLTDLALSTNADRRAQFDHKTEIENPDVLDTVRTVNRAVIESPIDYLLSRKDKKGVALIGKQEWNAGDRLRSDFTRANMLPAIGMRWGEPIRSSGAGGSANQTDAAMAARARVNKALIAVGPEFSGLLLDVCCFLKGLEQVELERCWPQRSAKLMVRTGLSILARHYAPPKLGAARIRSWGAEDSRPVLSTGP